MMLRCSNVANIPQVHKNETVTHETLQPSVPRVLGKYKDVVHSRTIESPDVAACGGTCVRGSDCIKSPHLPSANTLLRAGVCLSPLLSANEKVRTQEHR